MTSSTPTRTRPASALIWIPFLILCLIAAAAAIRRIAAFAVPPSAAAPPQLQALDTAFAANKARTLAHIVPALAFIVILPAWFSRRIRANTVLHRRVTIALFILGTIIGLTALALSTNPVGGITEQSATLLYDFIFLFSLTRAAAAFFAGNQQTHHLWMTRAIAVLLGIAATRPVMGVFFATESRTHLTPHQFFGIAFWIGFTSTFLAGELYLRRRSA